MIEMELTASTGLSLMLPQWLQPVVQSTFWVEFCGTNAGDCGFRPCSGSSNEEDIPDTFPQLPCSYHALVFIVHLLFIVIWSIGIFLKAFNNFFRPGAVAGNNLHWTQQQRMVALKTRRFFRASIVLSAFLFLLNLFLGILDLLSRWLDGSSNLPLHVEAITYINTVAWLILVVTTNSIRKQNGESIPLLMRAWWIASFVLSLLSLIPNSLSFEHTDKLTVEAWLETGSILVTGFLFAVALLGQTGVTSLRNEALKEPLLEEAKEGSAEGPCVSPYATAGFFSRLSLSWLNPLIALGSRKRLDLEDIPLAAPWDKSDYNYSKLMENWFDQTERDPTKSPSLHWALWNSFWKEEIYIIFLATTIVVASYVSPLLIDDFVEYLAGRRRFAYEGFLLILAFFLSQIVSTVAVPAWYLAMQFLGLHLRSSLTAFVFKKGLRLSSQSRQGHTTGEIINYVSVDVNRVGEFSWYMHEIFVLPFQLVLALLILYKVIGVATISALVASIIVMVSNMPLATLQDSYQEKLMEAKDKRMKALTESLRSMQVLKFQAWETKYLSQIEDLRKIEYHRLKSALYTKAAINFVFWASPLFVSVATFGTCILLGTPLTAGRILSALATFRVLQEPITQIPDALAMLSQTKISLERLGKYLLEEELQEDAVIHASHTPDGPDVAVEIDAAEFSWDPAVQTPTLQDINLHAIRGQRVAICGAVGSGKSTLLCTILGEITKTAGTVKVCGTIAYVAQTAWIQSGTIEENILFGDPMKRDQYQETLRVCSLEKDIGMFDYGDQTIIGERGINMSGGQKQRIQLARAVYQDADIYLLDDPFSAVDAHTGSDLFQSCILGTLSTKTVLYVTHQVEFLPAADLILVMRDGKIIQSGKYDDLLQAGTDFDTLVDAHNEAIDFIESEASKNQEEDGPTEEDEDLTKIIRQLSQKEKSEEGSEDIIQIIRQLSKKEKTEEDASPKEEKRQLVEDELRAVGNTSLSVYWAYLTAVYKGSIVPIIFLAQLGFQGLQITSNYWMAWFTPATAGEPQKVDNTTLILVYFLLAMGSALSVSGVILLTTIVQLLAGQKLFINMLRAIFRAPMSFFDSTPTGRILARASSDQDTVDSNTLKVFMDFVFETVRLLGVAFVMSQITWKVLLLYLPVSIICLLMQRYYIKTARELQRLSGISRSPIIHHYGESIAGAVTIRGFDRSEAFLLKILELYDKYGRINFHSFSAIQWLVFRLEMLSNCVFTFALFYAVTYIGGLDPGIAGLAVTYGLQLNVIQTAWIWMLGSMENRIISVERILQYTSLQPEAALVIEDSRPPKEWPNHGTVELHDLKVRYNDHSPYVLHGLTCTFQGGQKIGIVGRTGSGKSTLIQTLFRMIEPSEGRIVIDGIDVSKIGLHDLRNKLSIIPQDPTLFEGTLRVNLDPLQQYTDFEIWEALDKCQLGDVVRAKEDKLDSPVNENGENWSVGQRQLVCLGRALLKRTTILVLDEATASVDTVTDGVIQRTIRSEFADRSVITVAHRIPTIIDSDQALVLSDGRIAEYDSPTNLLQRRSSLFYKLVAEYASRSKSVNDLMS
ncbi:unnamed protein product [Calypogeia fissa]